MPSRHQQSGLREGPGFQHSLTTPASAQSIWALWTNVANWPTWDTELQAAQLNGPFELGATGVIVPAGQRRQAFRVTECVTGSHYAITLPLPLGSGMLLRRSLESLGDATQFTHEVRFFGVLGRLLALLLGARYRAALPTVMDRLRQQAETDGA